MEYVDTCVYIPVTFETAKMAVMNSDSQWLVHHFMTVGTFLACVFRIHQHDTLTSTFSLVSCVVDQLIPTGIAYAFGQMVIFQHIFDFQIFKGNYIILIQQLSAYLMGIILPLVRNIFMLFGQ